MKLTDAARICDNILAANLRPEEQVAILCLTRFVKRVVKARSSIRDVADALEVDLNQQELFGDSG